MNKSVIFVRDQEELEKKLLSLKHNPCVYCGKTGTLNRHDKLRGNNHNHKSDIHERGQRAWCSNRGKRGGCGKTMTYIFSWGLPGHSFTAPLLWEILTQMVAGKSIKSAFDKCSTLLSLEGTYHLLQRFRKQLTAMRSALMTTSKPPGSVHADPLLQTVEHLVLAFPFAECPVSAFQTTFLRPIMG